MKKPYSQACENNKAPILSVLKTVYASGTTVCEIGSGTGQHGCYFASQLPEIHWQPTDVKDNLQGIHAWIADSGLKNIQAPLELNVCFDPWPVTEIKALFTANTLHIMSWAEVEILFQRLSVYLTKQANVCIYGPFNYNGAYTSDSNASFDLWLKQRNPKSGIRDFEAVLKIAEYVGLNLLKDHTMPANNRLLVFKNE